MSSEQELKMSQALDEFNSALAALVRKGYSRAQIERAVSQAMSCQNENKENDHVESIR
jgi:Holliday junction resolvasome RuvABC DNA-binding subunit